MTSDGVNGCTWDRANRLLTWDNGVAADLVNHIYDGEGRRVSQAVGTTSPLITKYLLDIQPGLAVVLSQTEGSDITRFVHAPRGIHARQDASNDWHLTVQDGLGTVRVETDNSVAVEGAQNLDPFGNLIDMVNGDIDTPFGFTGELVDGSGLLDLRARRYNSGLGVFASLDPLETANRYAYVSGNPINRTDPTGLFDWCTGTVQVGDTLWHIATEGSSENGSVFATLDRLMSANPIITDPNNIATGMTLNLPPDIKAYGLVNTSTTCSEIVTQSPPLRNVLTDTGYIEGISASLTIGRTQGVFPQLAKGEPLAHGEEIVYNLATFERLKFNYTIFSVDILNDLALSGGPYIGAVYGLTNPYGSKPFEQFIKQYQGPFWFGSVGFGKGVSIPDSIPLLGGVSASLSIGGLGFVSPDGRVGGASAFLSGGISKGSGGKWSGTLGIAQYTVDSSYSKSYIKNCKVDVYELAADILTGDGSPFARLSDVELGGGYVVGQVASVGLFALASPFRLGAAIASRIAGEYYNQHNSCQC